MFRTLTIALVSVAMCLSALAQSATSKPAAAPASQPVGSSVQFKLPQAQEFPSSRAPLAVKYGNVPYAHVSGKDIVLDLYQPAKSTRPLPCIVWIHGGGWSAGSKDPCPAALFALDGYVVVSIDYRLTQEAPFPAQIHDCKGAIRFLRAHAGEMKIDPDRIGVWGASAGGHLVALLGTSGGDKDLEGDVGGNAGQSSRVQAVCDWYGPTDFTQFAKFPRAADSNKMLTQLFGGPLSKHTDLARQASPVTYADKNAAPFLIMHGDKDILVPLHQSELLRDALKGAGADVEMEVIKDAGHGALG